MKYSTGTSKYPLFFSSFRHISEQRRLSYISSDKAATYDTLHCFTLAVR